IPVSNGLNKEFLEQKVKEAIQCLDSVKPDYQWGSFFTHGIEIRCLLIKKSMQKLTIDGETFIKSGGYPSIESENDQFLNPDHYELSRTGYIFLLRLHRYELKKKVESRKYIPFDRAILENKGNIRLFMEWIEENRGESVMIEFKGEISRNPEKQDHTRKQIVAMANTSSGVLICGIIEQPDGTIEIKGIKNPDDEQKFIFSLVNNPKMSKNVCGELQEIQYNKKTLVLYFIRKPLEPARYAKDIYKRNGRQKEKVPTERWRHFLVDHFDRGSTGYVILEEFMKWKQKRSYQ
ncbi:MAG: helix-turn-helix domain-containing protein, partial [Candidatus Odinarchaeota archaeon]